ncbi:hypothetical protein [Leekyejoonella antrihumi]|uniref:Uncharacterized protein n=1 Tax=Leekyejoonella antrihumi TaxID=1660198 RepID=A0A563DS11_9MICO|nr:hypothetical protein [Leekyejoonella antrihumi]TWP32959.1 hypothetical protein FGL98_22715 [Leekyejoonella antrihumi]
MTCHVTLTDKEFTGRAAAFRDLAQHTAALINEIITTRPVGLKFSARILTGETHASGFTQAFHDFLRSCYFIG